VPIRVLAPSVAAGIAAGEVVERPASVVKELVENALDAASTNITVELRQGGMERIRVVDNGCGMAANEVELAFARHATSKLVGLDDLERITTMGFRGEALPSIAAAGRVNMVSLEKGADVAASVELTDGVVIRRGAASASPGTAFTVEELFADIPARRKFLRSPSAEAGRVRRVMEYLALASPHVQFLLLSDDKPLLRTAGNGSLRDVVAVVYGAETAEAMLDVPSTQAGPYQASGLVSPAGVNRPNRAAINLFVNCRWIQHRALTIAVEEAYQGFLMTGRFPVAVLFLEVPPAEVDVNVHPTKREVRFLREGDAFSIVQRAVRETLLAGSPVVEARGPLVAQAGSAAYGAVPAVAPSLHFTLSAAEGSEAVAAPAIGEQGRTPPSPTLDTPEALPVHGQVMPSLRVLGQLANTYLVAEGYDGMYLIDQHAAHEKVLFDRLLLLWRDHKPEVQPLLEPMPVELAPERVEAMQEALPLLERMGFQLEAFGEGTWLVRAVPAMARQVSIPRLVDELLDPRRDPALASSPTHYAMAASIACHSAVRAGQAMDSREMTALIQALAMAGNPRHCPHGRPTTIRVSTAMLDREFRRL
jgi:DNA mismatch repair protein MutL